MTSFFVDSVPTQLSNIPLCYNKGQSIRVSVTGIVSVSPHPGWRTWDKKYRTVDEWCAKNPGKLVGRLLTSPPVVDTYYHYVDYIGGRIFNYALAPPYDSDSIPSDAFMYEDFKAWNKARLS